MDKNNIYKAVSIAADQINESLSEDGQLLVSEDMLVTGVGSSLDSLTVVNLILAIEEKLASELSLDVLIFDESLVADPEGPFKNINSLVKFIHSKT